MAEFYVAAHALIRCDDRYLVTRRSVTNDHMPLKWDLPGGTVDAGETLEQALVREVKEETSLLVTPGRLLHAFADLASLPRRQTIQCVYLCDYPGGEVRLVPEEHDSYDWMSMSDLAGLDLIAFLADLVRTWPFRSLDPD